MSVRIDSKHMDTHRHRNQHPEVGLAGLQTCWISLMDEKEGGELFKLGDRRRRIQEVKEAPQESRDCEKQPTCGFKDLYTASRISNDYGVHLK